MRARAASHIALHVGSLTILSRATNSAAARNSREVEVEVAVERRTEEKRRKKSAAQRRQVIKSDLRNGTKSRRKKERARE